jgi:FMN phosphatase YigB (HAD superfamily)
MPLLPAAPLEPELDEVPLLDPPPPPSPLDAPPPEPPQEIAMAAVASSGPQTRPFRCVLRPNPMAPKLAHALLACATLRARKTDMDPFPPALVRDVDLLCLDAGNTVVFLDHARLAQAFGEAGFETTSGALNSAEGATKIALDQGRLDSFTWGGSQVPSTRSWGRYVGTMARRAGLDADGVPPLLDAVWPRHCAKNFWHLVPEGLPAALDEARGSGVKVAIVSNSEGKLEGLLEEVGLRSSLDLVIDSGIVGVEKPDPRIFRLALEHFGVDPSRALHLGDVYGTDVLGARAAGVRVALVDPFAHLSGHHPDVPRVPGAAAVARSIARLRRG